MQIDRFLFEGIVNLYIVFVSRNFKGNLVIGFMSLHQFTEETYIKLWECQIAILDSRQTEHCLLLCIEASKILM